MARRRISGIGCNRLVMQLLLDSHTLLWALDDAYKQLEPDVLHMINEPDNLVYVSLASLWELGIKVSIGKLKLPADFFESLPELGYEILTITLPHIKTYMRLPLHHRDPFDRILVAQAISEKLTLVTRDPNIFQYNVDTVKV